MLKLSWIAAESKAIYAQIKKYILENLKVSILYVVHVKKKRGIILRDHYNKSKRKVGYFTMYTEKRGSHHGDFKVF